MRRARTSVLFRYALAAALAAITVPFLAHAAFGDEAVATPVAQIFPTRQGIGVVWDAVDASGYRVERKQDATDWQDVSGPLTDSTTTWIDETIPAGSTAAYRVVATGETDPAASPAVNATRVAEAPAIGDIDVLALDANRGAGTTWLQDETADPVTASAPVMGSRTLAAGSLKVRIPAFLAGPGNIDLPATQIELTQGDRSCPTRGYMLVKAITYTPGLELETLAATLHTFSCEGTNVTTAIEIRYRSTIGYQALSVTPNELDFGRVRYDEAKDLQVTVRNTGLAPVGISGVNLGAYIGEWRVTSNNCPSSLPVGSACSMTVTFRAQVIGPESATLIIYDSTSLYRHQVQLSAYGVNVAAAQNVFVAPTYNGHSVSWRSLQTAGGTPVRGYNLHRYVNGAETIEWFAEKSSAEDFTVVEPSTTPGIEYAVSVVNEVGEGPTSARLPVSRGTEQIAITQGPSDTRDLVAADLYRHVVPFPADANSVKPKDAVTSSPDGASLAYVTNTTERVLWTQKVAPDGLGVPVRLWSSAAPITHLSWSPDGTRIAFQAPENDTPCVYLIAATGGTPQKVACQLSSPSWMPDAYRLMVDDHRLAPARLVIIEAKAGGARSATLPHDVAEITDDTPVRVSPDGRFVAFGSGSSVRLAGRSDKSPLLDSTVRAITWDPDGGWLLALTASGRLHRLVLSTAGELSVSTALASGTNRVDVAWQRLGVTIAPTGAALGRQISIPFDSSALPIGTRFTCGLEGPFTRPLEPCTSPVTASELVSGDYRLTLHAILPDGSAATAYRTFTVDVSGPVARVVGPTYQASTAGTATVQVAATDASGVASYDVRYRRASYLSGFGAYVQPWTNTSATSMSLSVAAGYEYCVSVRAKDKFGNVGGWSAERCFGRPLDDRAMTMATTGWTRASWSAFYSGTATQTTAYGKSLTRTVQGKRFYLVATRCATCGVVSVYAGGKYVTAVNLASATTQRQALIALPVQSALFSGTLTFTTRSTGKLVQIDGLVVRRT
jgi:WD40 repeat protein